METCEMIITGLFTLLVLVCWGYMFYTCSKKEHEKGDLEYQQKEYENTNLNDRQEVSISFNDLTDMGYDILVRYENYQNKAIVRFIKGDFNFEIALTEADYQQLANPSIAPEIENAIGHQVVSAYMLYNINSAMDHIRSESNQLGLNSKELSDRFKNLAGSSIYNYEEIAGGYVHNKKNNVIPINEEVDCNGNIIK